MTNIAFYLLSDTSTRAIELIACHLVLKAYNQGNHIYINAKNIEQALILDELLWTFKPEAFIPHINLSVESNEGNEKPETQETNYLGAEQGNEPFNYPVIINTGSEIRNDLNPDKKQELLINLDTEVPLFFSRFHRLAELVGTNEETKKEARLRFKFYKDRGYEITTHDIS